MSFNYKNPLSSTQLDGTNSVSRTSVFGTNFSVLQTGGYMEIYHLSGLTFTIPNGSTGLTEYSGNTIPIQFTVSNNVNVPNVLTLNSDNISSGRQRLGMLVYVYENNTTYQLRIPNYDELFTSAVTTNDVTQTQFGTAVTYSGQGGVSLINAWTANTIDGVGGYTKDDAKWVVYVGDGGGASLVSGTTSAGTGSTTAITLNLVENNGTSGITVDLSNALTYINPDPVKKTVGGIEIPNAPFVSGMTFQQIIDEIFYPKLPPTILFNRFSSFLIGGTGLFDTNQVYEVGTIGGVQMTAGIIRGQSTATGQPIKYMGFPNTYTFTGNGFTTQTFSTADLSRATTDVSYTGSVGTNTFYVKVDYNSGDIPVYDDGSPYNNATFINAGSISTTTSFNCNYPFFANTLDITDSDGTKLTLAASTVSEYVFEYFQTEINDPTGSGVFKNYIDIAQDYPKNLTDILYYDGISKSYVSIFQNFSIDSTVTHNIQGVTIDYDRWENNYSVAAGGRTIKLIFS
jgi:hypothetical protein